MTMDRRVLFIEDDPAGRELGLFNLKKAGYQTEVARDGAEGLELFEQGAYDLVITDLKMPGVVARTSVIHCSMADASWVQTSEQVENPYHGSSMLRCGEVTKQRGVR